MQAKIGLEEHFAIPDTLGDSKGFLADATWPELESRLIDMQERRIREMDAHGMQMMILSLNAPAIQAIWEPKKATDVARRANDFLAKEVAKRFVRGREHDRIGLVAFAGRAELISPVTLDYDGLNALIDGLDFGMLPDGTAVGSAIALGAERLRLTKGKSRKSVCQARRSLSAAFR